MQVILSILSAALVVLALWDVFITVFSSSGAGHLTRWWIKLLWRALLAVRNHQPIHKPVSLAGPLMLQIGIVIG